MGPMPTHGWPTIPAMLLIHGGETHEITTLAMCHPLMQTNTGNHGTHLVEKKICVGQYGNLHQKYGIACCAELLYILVSYPL